MDTDSRTDRRVDITMRYLPKRKKIQLIPNKLQFNSLKNPI